MKKGIIRAVASVQVLCLSINLTAASYQTKFFPQTAENIIHSHYETQAVTAFLHNTHILLEPSRIAFEQRIQARQQQATYGVALLRGEVNSIYTFMAFHIIGLTTAFDLAAHVVHHSLSGNASIKDLFLSLLGMVAVEALVLWKGIPLVRRIGVGIHEFGHLNAAIKSNALRRDLLPAAKAEWETARKSHWSWLKYVFHIVWNVYPGKIPYVIRDDKGRRQFYVPLAAAEVTYPVVVRAGPLADYQVWKYGIGAGAALYVLSWVGLWINFAPSQGIEYLWMLVSAIGVIAGRLVSAQAVAGRLAIMEVDDRAYYKLKTEAEHLQVQKTSNKELERETRYKANRAAMLDIVSNEPPYRVQGKITDPDTGKTKDYFLVGIYRNRILLHGGEHAKKHGGNLSWQEFKIFGRFNDPDIEAQIINQIKQELLKRIQASPEADFVAVGPEGGFIANFTTFEAGAMDILVDSIENAGKTSGKAGFEAGGLKKALPEKLQELDELEAFRTLAADHPDRVFVEKTVYNGEADINPRSLDPEIKGRFFDLIQKWGWRPGVWIKLDLASESLQEAYRHQEHRDDVNDMYRFYRREQKLDLSGTPPPQATPFEQRSDDIRKLAPDLIRLFPAERHRELALMSDYDLYVLWFALKYPVINIEDVKGGRDWQGWINSTDALTGICDVTADDVASTNARLLLRLIEFAAKQGKKAFTKVLLKINQIGTDAETLLTIRVMDQHGYQGEASHRSGSGLDAVEADIAAAANLHAADEHRTKAVVTSGKLGGVDRAERSHKYRRSKDIEGDLVAGSITPQPDARITHIQAEQDWTSDNRETVRVRLRLSTNEEIDAVVPIGASVSEEEAIFIFDHPRSKQGVFYAVQQAQTHLIPLIMGDPERGIPPLDLSQVQSVADTTRLFLLKEKEIALKELDALAHLSPNNLTPGNRIRLNRAALQLTRRLARNRGLKLEGEEPNGTLRSIEDLLEDKILTLASEFGNDIDLIVDDNLIAYLEHAKAAAGKIISSGLTQDELRGIMELKAFLGMNAILPMNVAINRAVASVRGMSYSYFMKKSEDAKFSDRYLYSFTERRAPEQRTITADDIAPLIDKLLQMGSDAFGFGLWQFYESLEQYLAQEQHVHALHEEHDVVYINPEEGRRLFINAVWDRIPQRLIESVFYGIQRDDNARWMFRSSILPSLDHARGFFEAVIAYGAKEGYSGDREDSGIDQVSRLFSHLVAISADQAVDTLLKLNAKELVFLFKELENLYISLGPRKEEQKDPAFKISNILNVLNTAAERSADFHTASEPLRNALLKQAA